MSPQAARTKMGQVLAIFKKAFFFSPPACNLEGFLFPGLTTFLSLLSASKHWLGYLMSCKILLKARYRVYIYKNKGKHSLRYLIRDNSLILIS